MTNFVKANIPVLVFMVLIVTALSVILGRWLGEKYGDPNCTCTGQSDSAWIYSGSVLIANFLLFLIIIFTNPSAFVGFNVKSEKATIVVFIIALIISLVGWSLYGASKGDPNCDCHSSAHVTWDISGGTLALLFCIFIAIIFFSPGFMFKEAKAAESIDWAQLLR